jgi:hypothetical protein
MEVVATGFLLSFVLWAVLAFASLQVSLKLHRDAGLPEKWLLVVPFLFAWLVFYGVRYRLAYSFLGHESVTQLFSAGAYPTADRVAFLVTLPILYVISVIRPGWVTRTWVNLPLLILLPFALKLAVFSSGLAPWDANASKSVSTRLE